MIDLSSVCIKEHLSDCDVVVIYVLGDSLLVEPLLGHGLLIELDVSLCDEAVLGLITFEGEVLVIGSHLNLSEVEGQEETIEDRDEEEKESEVDEKVKEVRKNAQLMHATWWWAWDGMRRKSKYLESMFDGQEMSVTTVKQKLATKTVTQRVFSRVPQVF